MAFSGGLGLSLDLSQLPVVGDVPLLSRAFAEDASRYLLEVDASDLPALAKVLGDAPHAVIGSFESHGEFVLTGAAISARVKVAALGEAWSSGMTQIGFA
jgi:hypothetical protein